MESMSLLNMLAEIASEKLQTDPAVRKIKRIEEENAAKVSHPTNYIHQNHGKRMTLLQVSSFSENNILKLFAISQANELKRKFYFTCRLVPQHCEETFQSFGSEDKARNLMKKHLKHHLQELLEEFKDLKSRENYILHAVEKGTRTSSCDQRLPVVRKKNSKLEAKTKSLYEKENTTKPFMSNELCSIKVNTHRTYEAKAISKKPQAPSLNRTVSIPESMLPSVTTGTQVEKIGHAPEQKENYANSVQEFSYYPNYDKNNSTDTSSKIDPIESTQVNKDYLNKSEDNGVNKNTVTFINICSIASSTDDSQYTLNSPNYDTQNSLVIKPSFNPTTDSSKDVSSEGNDVHEANISTAHTLNDDSNDWTLAENVVNTEIIDIKGEEPIKMEVIETWSEEIPKKEPNSSISHDHGYEGGEAADDIIVKKEKVDSAHTTQKQSEARSSISHDLLYDGVDLMNYMAVEKEEIVETWDHPDHKEFTDTTTQVRIISPSVKLQNYSISHNTDIESSPPVDCKPPCGKGKLKILDKESKKNRIKGKGKFIGQSKDEKEMALSMIQKIKSHPFLIGNLECHICSPKRMFTAPSTLLSHYKSHAGIRPYVCNLCDAVFTRQHSLNYHLLIHSNQTRFTCDDCGRKFRHPSHFKEHRRRHTGESPYECMDCFMRFKTRNTYKRHLRTRHGKKLTTEGSIFLVATDDCQQKSPKEESHRQVFKDDSGESITLSFNYLAEKVALKDEFSPVSNGNYSEWTIGRGQENVFGDLVGNFNYSGQIPCTNQRVSICNSTKEPLGTKQISVEEALSQSTLISRYHEMKPLDVTKLPVIKDDDYPGGNSPENHSYYCAEVPKSSVYNDSLHYSTEITDKCIINSSYADDTCQISSEVCLKKEESMLVYVNSQSQSGESTRSAVENSNEKISACSSMLSGDFVQPCEAVLQNCQNMKDSNASVIIKTSEVKYPHILENSINLSNETRNQISPVQVITSTELKPSSPLHGSCCNESKSTTEKSILSSLLTCGREGGSQNVLSPIAPIPEIQESSEDATVLPDKWDTLMQEVVSLSSAVKEKDSKLSSSTTDPLSSSSQISVPKVELDPFQVTPMKELSNTLQQSRLGAKESKEVFVFKYVNNSSGNRITKVFKAKSLKGKDITVAGQRK